jgi:hypothetical protein
MVFMDNILQNLTSILNPAEEINNLKEGDNQINLRTTDEITLVVNAKKGESLQFRIVDKSGREIEETIDLSFRIRQLHAGNAEKMLKEIRIAG